MKEQVKLGGLVSEKVGRDAVHVAIVPVRPTEKVFPGQDVGLMLGSTTEVTPMIDGVVAVGIIDPFLDGAVFPGQWCYLTLYPNTITSLRHEWEHPAFDSGLEEGDASAWSMEEEAQTWLTKFAESAGMSYDMLVKRALKYEDGWGTFGLKGSETARDAFYSLTPEKRKYFWECIGVVTDRDITSNEDDVPFSCSC